MRSRSARALLGFVAFFAPTYLAVLASSVAGSPLAESGWYTPALALAAVFLVRYSIEEGYLSPEVRVVLAAPIPVRRVFHARFLRTLGQSSWMVVIFLAPVLMGIGRARCAGPGFYATAVLTTVPFAVIPVAAGSLITLLLVNTFPARDRKSTRLNSSHT